ncbi:enoyl-CoA hydratase/isomerase family protein [Rhodococcus sp. BP-149]|nr:MULTISPECIES: 3-hydroxyacyl-CoA dehydrogenase NAD-binding domain-containing protein [unclassified Rhodococcus (in: high G+C Gram-positive bacteria)]MBY6687123.1 enoyl-CoA hydratase/isomerase family protein [Rhodococcus sp. BP-288]MBY6693824.1 enoyl-CoA hydratase/isomerase family protein [Rhodococcus sp. BP-188]MBY6699235.1 enoyl-CoA hydratase/isomerase family protein [Rhodococcus sp. BP-285]MBY6702843.1 enoyl-CoA hydratase/isomerase family protein [Rhodococcus sp. BP-283]MBY6711577.1 enoyl-
MIAMTSAFADEVVTHAFTRIVTVPGLDGPVAIVTLDNGFDHTKPSTFGPAGLAELDAALDAAYAARPVAVAVTGKPFIFAVGADLNGVPNISDRAVALEIGTLGHKVFRRLRESTVPTFAFVNGAALGGGLEIALHCHYRTVADNAAALGLPETFLGLVPGWGGTQLLPNLIGPANAVTVVIENALNQNRMLKPADAQKLGIADEVFGGADFLEQSLLWAAKVVSGDVTPARPEIDRDQGWDDAIARAKAIVSGKTGDHAPGPVRAVQLLELAKSTDITDSASLDAAFAAEDEALADLLMADELRAGLYAFDLVQKRAKRPAGAPDKSLARKVTGVGIVGAGLMASQLALLFVRQLKVPVILTDIDQERIDKGVGYVHAEIDKLQGKKRLSPDAANRLKALVSGSLDKSAFATTDWVIEAVFENLDVKKKVFAELEEFVSPETILATNTSSLSITRMAAELKHPERVVGFHFFNPVAVLPLLEIVRGEKTDDATLATAFATAKSLKKSAVLIADKPGFVFNRLLTRALGEVMNAIDEGTPFDVADNAISELGMPMSPLTLLSLVGPAVALHTGETMAEYYPERFHDSPGLQAMVANKKSAVWTYGADGAKTVDPEIADLWPQGDSPSTAEQVLDRTRRAFAEEIDIMLQEGVVAAAQDIDLCLILGGGFGFWNGGIVPYLDRTGTSEAVTGHRFLDKGVASV